MHFSQLLTPIFFAGATLAAAVAVAVPNDAPSKTIEKRATTICGQWDSVTTGTYILYNDQWGISAATSGSQCSTYNSLSGNSISWSTSWTWAGGPYSVKSFANVVVQQSTGVLLSSISTIPTSWKYTYTGSNIIADVAYDIFTSSTATGSSQFEIMVWLAALGGAGPISATGSAIASPTINGVTWHLFYGLNGSTKVFSFVASSQVTSFSGDLKLFLTYLVGNNGFAPSQYVTSIGAGTEPFTGSNAVLSVSAYSVSYVLGSSESSGGSGTITTTSAKATTTSSSGTVAKYGQCGGSGYTGSTVCASGSTCTYSNAWYSQCL